jgi:hypothetical protein
MRCCDTNTVAASVWQQSHGNTKNHILVASQGQMKGFVQQLRKVELSDSKKCIYFYFFFFALLFLVGQDNV